MNWQSYLANQSPVLFNVKAQSVHKKKKERNKKKTEGKKTKTKTSNLQS